jgi:hypothetical protein
MINGFRLLKDPKPIKEEISVPLITWDEVLKTSNILDNNKKRFTIQNTSDREKTLYNLLNKNIKNNQLSNTISGKLNNVTSNNFLKPSEKM